MLNKILKKIKNKNIVIAIVGLGFVGLPLCVRFINSGNKVLGILTELFFHPSTRFSVCPSKVFQMFHKYCPLAPVIPFDSPT